MQPQGVQIDEQNRFQVEVTSNLEPWLVANVCQPVLEWLPESIHPNTISIVNHLVCWFTLAASIASTYLPPNERFIALVGAGIGVFVSLLADCLDGMQARRTNRCSKVGELLDHWLDAINVPILFVGITVALRLEPWMLATVHITGAMIYNAQLVFYHNSGRFVGPPTSGTDGAFGTSFGFIVLAFIYHFFDRHTFWLNMAITGTAALCIYVNTKLNVFFYVRLKKLIVYHLPFVAFCLGFGALYLFGIIGMVSFVLAIIFVSFRVSGTYVLYTIIGKRFNGADWNIALWIAAIALGHAALDPIPFGQHTLQYYLPAMAYAYMVTRNLIDFVRYFPLLRSKSELAR
jgi:phosphatidylglycerophosphate synthase